MPRRGLVLEGGAMRGLFSCGVTDVFLEEGIAFDGMIGVSAGAVFGCNFKSKQAGRALRYNQQFCRDWRYCSWRSFLLTGNLFGEQLCYHDIPERLDPFDNEAFQANPMAFYVAATDADTGEAVYHQCLSGQGEDLEWMRASASMPLVSRVVEVGGYHLLDGGVADSIPLKFFQGLGYDRNVVILTQPRGYLKGPNPLVPLAKGMLHGYPKVVEAMAHRHEKYNETTAYIEAMEQAGQVFAIRPPKALGIGHIERDPQELARVYHLGRETARGALEAMRVFLNEPSEGERGGLQGEA